MPSGPEKVTVRRARRTLRRDLVAARNRAADAAGLAERVIELVTDLGLMAGASIAAFESLPTEPPTPGLIRALQSHGVRVLLPITRPDLDLDWFDAADPDRAPLGREAIAQVALVLAPGLAVDAAGTRLGQGGGSYDRALPRVTPGTPIVVTLHPGEEYVDPLPVEPHDLPAQGVLTAEGLSWISPSTT